ncbi:PREDICTED: E3 ubiquitin-protein ligase TRIM71-like [Amphimedon queenslandica]|uniref:B box-type domain-containing protein n=1 Tax=Amphimedon queenslandica TaxID=400682 RepID=A0AAN0IN11_AMPQE|nr:PREDICTED: E3 ubiquitin-protein ligase TRIM71-like [Amphimedon queenslandica]|eukprot:XP_011405168.1 PREDICTED: E3 ubiquitin-protein ligase TRIM71-like [Amphimedon queenslandica]
MKRTASLSDTQVQIIEATCSDHGKPLELFCETCNTAICSHCCVRKHKHHDCDLVTDVFTKHCQKLRECLLPVEAKKVALKRVLSALTRREGEIREKGELILKDIHKMVEEMMDVLRESERKLTEQAKRVTDDKLRVLSEQIKSAKINLGLLEDVEDYVKESLKTGSPQQVLGFKEQMIEHMSEVTAQVNIEKLQPKEKADFALSKDIKSLHHIGDIVTYSSTALEQCKVKKIDSIITTEKTVSFPLSIEAQDSSLLSVPVSFLRCSLVPAACTIAELNGPWGVAVSDENLIMVTEWGGHCVTILDREGKKVKSLGGKGRSGNVKFSSPRGIAITPDKCILVSDNHRIQKISMDGHCLAIVGKKGSGPLQFIYPDVLNPDLSFNRSFGSEGSASGQFRYPNDIAIDCHGLVYITDSDNHCIQKFSPNGKFVGWFGIKGSGPGELNRPNVFTSDGVFVSSFGGKGSDIDHFQEPLGLTFDRNGYFYVCDHLNRQLFVY